MAIAIATAIMAAQPSQAALAGDYGTNQMEVAGGLQLQPGGKFRYALDYGAVSEVAEGDWSFDGRVVQLTSSTRGVGLNPESSWASFRMQPLVLDGGDLLLNRYDIVIRFERVRPDERQED